MALYRRNYNEKKIEVGGKRKEGKRAEGGREEERAITSTLSGVTAELSCPACRPCFDSPGGGQLSCCEVELSNNGPAPRGPNPLICQFAVANCPSDGERCAHPSRALICDGIVCPRSGLHAAVPTACNGVVVTLVGCEV
jgi:hypothetical protein